MKIQKALIIVFGFLLSSTAFAGDYSLKTGTGVSKSSNSYLENTKKDYSLDESIYAFVTMKDFQDETVIPPKRAASKSRINTSPAFSAGRVSLLKPSYAFALE